MYIGLTTEQREAIIADYLKTFATLREIASRHGVSKATVSNVISKHYKKVMP
jgi:lambda repressor-like predicted transcriptional regulator